MKRFQIENTEIWKMLGLGMVGSRGWLSSGQFMRQECAFHCGVYSFTKNVLGTYNISGPESYDRVTVVNKIKSVLA